jgi:alkylated DNA nucleotide flippase Atl1
LALAANAASTWMEYGTPWHRMISAGSRHSKTSFFRPIAQRQSISANGAPHDSLGFQPQET